MDSTEENHKVQDNGEKKADIPVFLAWFPLALTAFAVSAYVLGRNSPWMLWAFNLWDYLPVPLSYVLMALTLLFSLPPVLKFVATFVEKLGLTTPNLSSKKANRFLRAGLVGVGLFLLFWVFSERRGAIDTYFFIRYAQEGRPFIFKEAGGTFLFFVALHLANALGVEHLEILRIFICGSGVLFIFFLYKLICLLYEPKVERLLAGAFLIVPGYIRLYFGHIEMYGFLLTAVCAYLYFAIRYAKGKNGILPPALLLGLSTWLHLSAVLLLPSLIYSIHVTGNKEKGGHGRAKVFMKAALFFIMPFAAFLLVMLMLGYQSWIRDNLVWLLTLLGLHEDPMVAVTATIPFFKPRVYVLYGNVVSQYTFLSKSHVLFLLNANAILSPGGLLVCVPLLFLYIRKNGLRDTTLTFILIASLSLFLYSLIIYPMYWAYDWDLFSATAFCYTFLAAYLLMKYFKGRKVVAYLVIYLASFSLFFVTLPFLSLASMRSIRNAGPFAIEIQPFEFINRTMGNPDALMRLDMGRSRDGNLGESQ
ncbi:MAG: hypothetical protein C4532_05635 [Candidatus Abyssobacteria bacterium SURF_17]|uniref:Glycosyltransferase RgtA/B/C/D-like domain-containing protein n=1 Tax=Candidatus Abyssobacteria bacterium SURF_17 TaxID=2093361 RepID=A0A419F2P6_9BACT|nr:MAG: hypothetical protein C4532_05635 [Candidatus Abyssubacteria bacterium SURF_17]